LSQVGFYLFSIMMNKYQLKKLIREVIREADEMSAKPDDEKEPEAPDTGMHHSTAFQKKQEDNVIKLTLRGLKPGKAYKEMMAGMAWEAKKKDLEVIHAEIEKAGKPVVSMDSGELKSMGAHHAPEEEHGEEEDVPAYRKKAEYSAQRMAKMQQGEREPEWKAATEKDLETARAKARLRSAQEKAGTLKLDPATGLPADTSLWTDREWDEFNAGEEATTATTSTGKQAYRPRFSKKSMAQTHKVPVNVGQLRH
jgi:hypothetical protein